MGHFITGFYCGATVTAMGFAYMYLLDGTREFPSQSKSNDESPSSNSTSSSQGSVRGARGGGPGRGLMRGMTKSSALSNNLMTETSFFTEIIEKLWPHMKIAIGESIKESVEPIFADLPGPMKTCRFVKVDLGNVPLKMDNILVHPLQPDGSVQWDVDICWDGECNFQLKADFLGKFGIKHLKLDGRMAIVFKALKNALPVIDGIQYSFINMPQIDLDFSGLAAVADFKVLEKTVQETLESGLSSLVLPYRSLYKLGATCDFFESYLPPLGVLRVTAEDGKGFVVEKRRLAKDDVPDVYLKVKLGKLPETFKTKTVKDSLSPVWQESGDLCVFDREQILNVHAWDEDKGQLDGDDDLGTASTSVGEILRSPKREVTLPLYLCDPKSGFDGDTGASVRIKCDLCEWTTDLTSLDAVSANKNIKNEICGLLVVIINKGFDIPLDQKIAYTHVKVTYAGKEYLSNAVYDYPGLDSLNPCYDSGITIPITSDMPRADETEIKMELIHTDYNKLKVVGSTVLGSISYNFGSLKALHNNTVQEKRAIGSEGASLEYRISLSGVSAAPSGE